MASEFEVQFHRTFLNLKLALAIWNEDYTYQNQRGGPPDRQRKREADAIYDYHVRQGPHYPAKPPGDPLADKKYNAFLAKEDGSFDPIVITTKRGLTGQNFSVGATTWELTNSVLCSSTGKFTPIVNSAMEVTGHYANLWDKQVIRPDFVDINDPADCITKEVPIYLWIQEYYYGKNSRDNLKPPEGWIAFTEWHGGIDILVLPNGEVVGAMGKRYQNNNGSTYSVISPLDFWAPGSRAVAAGIRGLTNRLTAAAVRGLRAISVPTKELAMLSAARLSKTLPGMAVPTRAVPFEHFGRRTLIMGEDAATFKALLARSHSHPGFYDVMIHGDTNAFHVLVNAEKNIWREVTVKEVAELIGPRLSPGDKIRLLACEVGKNGGPAQRLANELGREVWAPSTTLPAAPTGRGGRAFVPDNGGKFYQFVPERGAAIGRNGAKITGNQVKGTIRNAR